MKILVDFLKFILKLTDYNLVIINWNFYLTF